MSEIYKSEVVYRQISYLHDILGRVEGKIKTLAEATIADKNQLKAFKDLVGKFIHEENDSIHKCAQWLAFSLRDSLNEEGAFEGQDFIRQELPNWNPFKDEGGSAK